MTRLFEFSDQAWLPACFRRFLTELIQFQETAYRLYWPAIPKLNEALRRSHCREVLDLCSGSGGPLVGLHPHLCARRFTLSDRFPPPSRATIPPDGRLRWLERPLDALDAPPRPRACRTLFSSFHHFGEDDARRILRSAVDARAPIAIFEFTERSLVRIAMLALAPLRAWVDTLRMRPHSPARLFWTFVVPLVPLLYTWDAIVSHLRTYSTRELRRLTDGLSGHDWEAGTLPPGARLARISFLVGVPTG